VPYWQLTHTTRFVAWGIKIAGSLVRLEDSQFPLKPKSGPFDFARDFGSGLERSLSASTLN
jgi:hypothetical protein